MSPTASLRSTATIVVAYAVAMAFVESAVVLYLGLALGSHVGEIFPLRPAVAVGNLAWVEAGREAATLVMIATVGTLAGGSKLERLAWGAVIFGTWDVAYYGWLWVFAGWPPSLFATDLLFLIPVPWVGPVWSPMAVSLALVGVGLAAARVCRGGGRLHVRGRHWVAGLAGGTLVVLSWTLDAPNVLAGGFPGTYTWPVFAAGMGLALIAAADVLRAAGASAARGGVPGP